MTTTSILSKFLQNSISTWIIIATAILLGYHCNWNFWNGLHLGIGIMFLYSDFLFAFMEEIRESK